MRKITVVIGILVLTSGSAAEAGIWSGDVRIASIEVAHPNAEVGTEGVWVGFTTDPFGSHACSVKTGQYMLGGGEGNVEKMTELATAALVNSRIVSVFWGGGCSGGGTSGYPVLLGFTLK